MLHIGAHIINCLGVTLTSLTGSNSSRALMIKHHQSEMSRQLEDIKRSRRGVKYDMTDQLRGPKR